MADEGFKRKLAAILSADVEGYSRLMDDDEEATVRTLTTYRSAINDLVQQYRGRIVDTPGDNILAEFISVVDAVNCAVEIQRELAERNAQLPDNRKMEFRIGVNLGDVIEEKGRIYGDGVNIAARVEAMSEAGGVCISGRAYDQVENKLGLEYENLGEHQVKNITRPIQVFRVLSIPGAAAHRVVQTKEAVGKRWRKLAIAVGAVALVVVIAVGIWQFNDRQSKSIEPASVEKMAFPLPDKPSIAVLPFDNLSGNPEQEYLCNGFTETLIGGLARIPDILVIARTSTFAYKGKPITVKQVAEELKVRYVIEGSIQKAEDQLRVTIQMIDAQTGYHVWSERYDRNIKEIFKTQDDITFEIVKKVSPNTQKQRYLPKHLAGTDNLEAYLDYLNILHIFLNRKTSPEALADFKRSAEKVIALDPNYPTPYADLAIAHVREARLGFSESPEKSRKQALTLAKKAVELDESNPYSYETLGRAYRELKMNDEAIEAYKQSLALSPGIGGLGIGWALLYMGKVEEAIPYFNEFIRIDPKYWAGPFSLAGANIFLGKYEEAIPYLKEAIGIWPGYFRIHLDLAACYATLGRHEEARSAVKEVLKASSTFDVEKYITNLPARNPEDIKYYTAALRKIPFPE